ncbi:MAG: class I SAM-dependent DNA methyltransferase [Chloroflexia bacterium]|nr:class I SAM-dependent DNA methyltransferase [Chloroflexia bacterium]
MPRISWNEIQDRAAAFAGRWAGETYEKGESQSFWSDFLAIYDIDRRRHGAFFEYAIKKGSGKQGFIDLFWPRKLLAEQKSGGKDTGKARLQAYEYLETMPDHDLPQAIVVSDFATFDLIDTRTNAGVTFPLEDLPKQVRRFAFLIDETGQAYEEENPVNRDAAENMAKLHNQLAASRYGGRDLELLLVRLVFCLFADDARIFERNIFANYLRNRTQADGSDFGPRLVKIFEVLNTPVEERQTTLDEDLRAFPYINGGLFEATIRAPDFTSGTRRDLLTAALLDWGKVSPAIFGSMFQGVMDAAVRRNLGAHYTSEKNILRVIKPLFLDDLYAEFARVRDSPRELRRFHEKLPLLNFLDPACGSGNFLAITYRELRRLEHKVVQVQTRGQKSLFDVRELLKVNVDQMHGIEIEEFPSLIAQTALWLTDHQMNLEASQMLGQHYVRLPLTASANIVHANALTTDWADVVAPERLSYVLGNPPFIGQTYQSPAQKREVAAVLSDIPRTGVLDFVSGWYGKATEMMQRNPRIESALVSTNSITQGEQASILWRDLLDKGVEINFAHQTFRWSNDARGVAAVHCIIVGFGLKGKEQRRIFEYLDIAGEPIEVSASNINPYLADAPDLVVVNRPRPLGHVPVMAWGNKPTDGGHFLLSPEERAQAVANEPDITTWIHRYIGGGDFINSLERYCLWLKDAAPQVVRNSAFIRDRVEKVREFRLASKAPTTRAYAQYPTLFRQISQPDVPYLAIPEVSSERRDYIPIAFFSPDIICSNTVQFIAGAENYHFGVLTSRMHMAWVRTGCGRLKSDYRYSKDIVYNNFPWPENVTEAQTAAIERLAQAVLDARDEFPGSTLADLYDPLTMPPALAKAHQALDRAVDRLYRKEPFKSDADRVTLLFERYGALVG